MASMRIVSALRRAAVVGPFIFALLPLVLGASECVLTPRKPVKVGGALCGTSIAFDLGERMEGAEVVLRDSDGVLVGSAETNSRGEFRFPALPKGKYRIAVPGFELYMSEVELTRSSVTTCKQPVIVYAGLHYCSGGYVGRKWDFKRFPDGSPPPGK